MAKVSKKTEKRTTLAIFFSLLDKYLITFADENNIKDK